MRSNIPMSDKNKRYLAIWSAISFFIFLGYYKGCGFDDIFGSIFLTFLTVMLLSVFEYNIMVALGKWEEMP